jgi:Zn-dependent protease
MSIYITRNGKQLGPYTVTEAQNLVLSGDLIDTDLAWQEGLANWIPLNQIPGFKFVPPPAPVVPVATTTFEALHRPPVKNKSLLQKVGTGIVASVVILFKFAAPLLVLLKTGGTMLLSILAYSVGFGWSWQMATGIVVLIFVHEMGHFISAKSYGISVSAPIFIPFVGAYVMLKNRPLDAWTNAVISYAGPLAGGLGGWAACLLGVTLDLRWLLAVAFYTFVLNLINLAPIPPLDGSHIWITFARAFTPNMTLSDRLYMAIFLAALIAGLLLGGLCSWRYLHPTY